MPTFTFKVGGRASIYQPWVPRQISTVQLTPATVLEYRRPANYQVDEASFAWLAETAETAVLDPALVTWSPVEIPPEQMAIVDLYGGIIGRMTAQITPYDLTVTYPDDIEWRDVLLRFNLIGRSQVGPGGEQMSLPVTLKRALFWSPFESDPAGAFLGRATFRSIRDEANQRYSVQFEAQDVFYDNTVGNSPAPAIEAIQGELADGEPGEGATALPVSALAFQAGIDFGNGTYSGGWRGSFSFDYSLVDANRPIRVRLIDSLGRPGRWYRVAFRPIAKLQLWAVNLDISLGVTGAEPYVVVPDEVEEEEVEEFAVGQHLWLDARESFDPDGELESLLFSARYQIRFWEPGSSEFEEGYGFTAVTNPTLAARSDDTPAQRTSHLILPDHGSYSLVLQLIDRDGLPNFNSLASLRSFEASRVAGWTDAATGISLAAYSRLEALPSAWDEGTKAVRRQYVTRRLLPQNLPLPDATADALPTGEWSAIFKLWRTGADWYALSCTGHAYRCRDSHTWTPCGQLYASSQLTNDEVVLMMIGCDMSQDGSTLYVLARVWGTGEIFTGEVRRFVLLRNAAGQYQLRTDEAVTGLDTENLGPGDVRVRGAHLTVIAQAATELVIKTSRDEMKSWE